MWQFIEAGAGISHLLEKKLVQENCDLMSTQVGDTAS